MLFYVYLILIFYCQTAYICNLLDVYMCMHGTNSYYLGKPVTKGPVM